LENPRFFVRSAPRFRTSFRGSRFGAAGAVERAATGATAPFGGAAAATEGRGRAEELQGAERQGGSGVAGGGYNGDLY
jgi:hypothetical protein